MSVTLPLKGWSTTSGSTSRATTSMSLMTIGLPEVLRIRTRSSVSRKVQVPPLPVMLFVLSPPSPASKTTSPGPALWMSFTTIVGSVITAPSPTSPAEVRTVTFTARWISAVPAVVPGTTISSGMRPERISTSELKAMFGFSTSSLPSSSSSPLASERLLTDESFPAWFEM